MKIEVTADDIFRGRPRHPELCPVARAVKRATKRNYVFVNYAFIDLAVDQNNRDHSRHKTPDAVSMFLFLFDSDAPTKPFEFELDYHHASGA